MASSNVPDTAVTWNYTTIPQIGLRNRTLQYPRGRVVGGTGSISMYYFPHRRTTQPYVQTDFMTYTRGPDDEYDRWAKLTGDSGWSWRNLAPYYFKVRSPMPLGPRDL